MYHREFIINYCFFINCLINSIDFVYYINKDMYIFVSKTACLSQVYNFLLCYLCCSVYMICNQSYVILFSCVFWFNMCGLILKNIYLALIFFSFVFLT